MEKAKQMQTVAEALWSVSDDTVGDLSPVELREIVEGDSPLNAAMSVYMCGIAIGARIERANPCQVELYEPKETTAAEYKRLEAELDREGKLPHTPEYENLSKAIVTCLENGHSEDDILKVIQAAANEKEAPGADQDEIDEDQELLALMFNDAIDKMTSGAFNIEQDVQFLKKINGVTRKAPFDLLITGFLIGVLEALQFDEKLHEEIQKDTH